MNCIAEFAVGFFLEKGFWLNIVLFIFTVFDIKYRGAIKIKIVSQSPYELEGKQSRKIVCSLFNI